MRRNYRGRPGWGRRWDRNWGRRSGRRLFRSRQGKILGVCAGLAEYFDLPVTGVRIVAVLLLIFTGFWPLIGIYILAGLLMKPAPYIRQSATFYQEEEEPDNDWQAEEEQRASRRQAVDRLKRTFDKLNRRLQNLEDSVTAKEFDWQRRYDQS
ncbi:MAG: envelope stress response membrane protein PspC [Deltaproteobacteria bacterium]|nr:envelope stress response membrane protein PspC [Deltaproteobacteria bacterium]